MSAHEIVNPAELAEPSGFSHAVVAAPGRTVYLGGQAGHDGDGSIASGLIEQFAQACSNVMVALRASGAQAEHLVSMQIFVTDVPAYRDALKDVGKVYQEHFGRHYPATALMGVTELFDPRAQVELVCVAVVPEST